MTKTNQALPGHPRSWEIERYYAPRLDNPATRYADLGWLDDQLQAAGYGHASVAGCVRWLRLKTETGRSDIAATTAARYRRMLADLPPAPWPPRPLGPMTRRTRQQIERQAGFAHLRALMGGVGAAGGAAIGAGASPVAVGTVLALVYITRNDGAGAAVVDPQRSSAAGVAMVCARELGTCAQTLARAA
jgi:hypothetical protein